MRKFTESIDSNDDLSVVTEVFSMLDSNQCVDSVKISNRRRSMQVVVNFSKICMKKRKYDDGYSIPSDEILEYWNEIYNCVGMLKNRGYESRVTFYQPNGVEMNIEVFKNNI